MTTATKPQTQAFEIPNDIMIEFTKKTIESYEYAAMKLRDQASKFMDTESDAKPEGYEEGKYYGPFSQERLYATEYRRFLRHPWLLHVWQILNPERKVYQKEEKEYVTSSVKVKEVEAAAVAAVAKAKARFESKINKYLKDGESYYNNSLRLNGDLIEGTVFGQNEDGSESFYIQAKLIWNYRYGTNSANGVLTQYVQFRGERH